MGKNTPGLGLPEETVILPCFFYGKDIFKGGACWAGEPSWTQLPSTFLSFTLPFSFPPFLCLLKRCWGWRCLWLTKPLPETLSITCPVRWCRVIYTSSTPAESSLRCSPEEGASTRGAVWVFSAGEHAFEGSCCANRGCRNTSGPPKEPHQTDPRLSSQCGTHKCRALTLAACTGAFDQRFPQISSSFLAIETCLHNFKLEVALGQYLQHSFKGTTKTQTRIHLWMFAQTLPCCTYYSSSFLSVLFLGGRIRSQNHLQLDQIDGRSPDILQVFNSNANSLNYWHGSPSAPPQFWSSDLALQPGNTRIRAL